MPPNSNAPKSRFSLRVFIENDIDIRKIFVIITLIAVGLARLGIPLYVSSNESLVDIFNGVSTILVQDSHQITLSDQPSPVGDGE